MLSLFLLPLRLVEKLLFLLPLLLLRKRRLLQLVQLLFHVLLLPPLVKAPRVWQSAAFEEENIYFFVEAVKSKSKAKSKVEKEAAAAAAEVVTEPEVVPKPAKKTAVAKEKKSAKTAKATKAGKSTSSSPAVAALAEPKKKSKQSCIVRAYMMAYNAVSAAAWAYLLFNLCRSYFIDDPKNYRALFPKTGMYLAYVQTAAVLEILHAAIGFVRSEVLTNVMQISSRLFIIWVCAIYYGIGKHWGYALLAFAWSLSDLTRYCYYFSQLAGWKVPLLKWARYNFFLVLYPVGTLGEVMLLLWARQKTMKEPLIYWPFLAVIAAYAPGKIALRLSGNGVFSSSFFIVGFLTMYEHMLKQRSKQAEKDKTA